MSSLRLVASALTLLITAAVHAEVRVINGPDDQPALLVRDEGGQVWEPRGPIDARTLNPDGDALGDGRPAAARKDSGDLLVAWHRPATGGIALVRADGTGPGGVVAIDAESVGAEPPVVAGVGDGWLVGWSGSDGTCAWFMAVSDGGESAPVCLLEGRLLGFVRTGGVTHAISHLSSADQMHVLSIGGFPVPMPIPVPIGRAVIPLRLETAARASAPLAGSEPWAPCIAQSDTEAVVAWKARDHQVGHVVLDEAGVRGEAEFERGPSGSCTAVLIAATRP